MHCEWLEKAIGDGSSTILYLKDCRDRLQASISAGYSHRDLLQAQFNQIEDQLIERGIINPVTGECTNRNVDLPRSYIIANAYRAGSAVRLFDLLMASKKMIFVHLLDSVFQAVNSGNLLVVLILLRSTIEHAAAHFSSVDGLKKIMLEAGSESTMKVSKLDTYLASRMFGTRLNWQKLSSDAETVFSKSRQRTSYKPDENRLNVSAEQILNDVDLLDKLSVKGIRSVYDFLCEFSHPNIGTYWALVNSTQLLKDECDVYWVVKSLGLGPPVGIVEEFQHMFAPAFDKVCECLRQFETASSDCKHLRQQIHEFAKELVRPFCQNNIDQLGKYSLCPCESGEKIKFCCGKK